MDKSKLLILFNSKSQFAYRRKENRVPWLFRTKIHTPNKVLCKSPEFSHLNTNQPKWKCKEFYGKEAGHQNHRVVLFYILNSTDELTRKVLFKTCVWTSHTLSLKHILTASSEIRGLNWAGSDCKHLYGILDLVRQETTDAKFSSLRILVGILRGDILHKSTTVLSMCVCLDSVKKYKG